MSFKKLSILAVLFLVALFLAGRVLAAVVASMTIQDQQIDLSAPNASVKITLPGDATSSIPIVITYDDGTTRYLTYTFNYKPPPTPEPVAQTCDYEEDVPSCPNGGLQTCTGTWQDGNCKYDGAVDPSCRNIRCNEPPAAAQPPPVSTAPGSNNSNDFSEYVRCGGCGEEIWACYDEDGKHERRFYGGDTAGYCTGPDWCGGGGSEPPAPECEDVYYCDNGTTIHKYGYHDGNTCQYSWDDIGEPC